MFPELTEQNNPVSYEDVQRFERRRGYKLPDAYRRFLLNTNGGRPRPSMFPIAGMHLNEYGRVHFFFGVGANLEDYDLEFMSSWFQHRIPQAVIPIACTAGSDYICLDLRDGREHVVFWDHRHFWGTGEWREQDIYNIADTFEGFLALLQPWDK